MGVCFSLDVGLDTRSPLVQEELLPYLSHPQPECALCGRPAPGLLQCLSSRELDAWCTTEGQLAHRSCCVQRRLAVARANRDRERMARIHMLVCTLSEKCLHPDGEGVTVADASANAKEKQVGAGETNDGLATSAEGRRHGGSIAQEQLLDQRQQGHEAGQEGGQPLERTTSLSMLRNQLQLVYAEQRQLERAQSQPMSIVGAHKRDGSMYPSPNSVLALERSSTVTVGSLASSSLVSSLADSGGSPCSGLLATVCDTSPLQRSSSAPCCTGGGSSSCCSEENQEYVLGLTPEAVLQVKQHLRTRRATFDAAALRTPADGDQGRSMRAKRTAQREAARRRQMEQEMNVDWVVYAAVGAQKATLARKNQGGPGCS